MGPWRTGLLPRTGRPYAFLQGRVFGDIFGFTGYPLSFQLMPLDSTGTVLRCDEQFTFVSVVLKLYGRKWLHGRQSGQLELRASLMHQEYENLRRARGLGLDSVPHRIIRPLAISEELGCALVEDYSPGNDLHWYLEKAASAGAAEEFSQRLTDVVWFLADLHNRSRVKVSLDGHPAVDYLKKVTGQLASWEVISRPQQQQFAEIGQRWLASGVLTHGYQVLIHGDVTPKQFLFPREHDLTVIDLERLRTGDRAEDLGRLAAELKHLFFWYTGDPWRSEPYIRQLYHDYVRYAQGGGDFWLLTERGRFFMGSSQLRIARNSWLDFSYRQRLAYEAQQCLQI